MVATGGFWSYVHADDDADGGRIQQLARDLVEQFEMLTGETVDLFLDRDSIDWGHRWEDHIDESLAAVAFFIPVLTPRYFLSAACRSELQSFARRAQALGVSELMLPLLYVDVPALREQEPADELAALVKRFQWQDWTDLRFSERTSGEYRRAVAQLAARLVEANQIADDVEIANAAASEDDTGNDELAPGDLDRMAEMEEAMPQWTETVTQVTQQIEAVGDIMRRGSREMALRDERGAGFAGRVSVARDTARELEPVAEQILALSSRFTAQLHSVDSGVRALIEAAPAAAEHGPDERDQACEFFDSVREMSESSSHGLGSLGGMIENSQPLERMSRDLRRPLRTLRKGLTAMSEAQEITDNWLRLVEQSPLNCEAAQRREVSSDEPSD